MSTYKFLNLTENKSTMLNYPEQENEFKYKQLNMIHYSIFCKYNG